ncbi:hypothetical protein JYU29_00090 [Tianweitania sp. BSSL-BM11]|uniref:Uncharacterized protein n=1 Tax=Tianweitania aestuarii TaxID=2814886 RepID=A0ABS5RTN1_9HYPH|nr:hypothetical protein [Tianweitania aestuarii]MBS9719082.1 hypothetical protein [Tianweitania aestuarii]
MDRLASLSFLVEPLLGYAFYAVACVPFVVWAGVATRNSTAARSGSYPGHAVTFWFLFLPLTLFATGLIRGFDLSDPATPYIDDEWGQVLTLLTVPATGWLLGYVVGVIMGSNER